MNGAKICELTGGDVKGLVFEYELIGGAVLYDPIGGTGYGLIYLLIDGAVKGLMYKLTGG